MKRTFGSRRGNSMVEFTLVGIPLIFALISIFELARGMWIYHTMAYAIKDTTRYVAVHGQLCRNVNIGCAVTMDNISRHLRDAAVGLLPNQLTNVTFATQTRTITCATLTSANCLGSANCFPTVADCTSTATAVDALPEMPLTITAQYPFRSSISMLWPGARGSIVYGTFNLPAQARERIQF
jgi:Flp pilus assembly protein TadG